MRRRPEVTEDEELTTLGILSAHFARRYHFICLGLTARSSLFPSHSSSTPLGSPPRSGRPSAGPEESGDGEGLGVDKVGYDRKWIGEDCKRLRQGTTLEIENN